MPKIVEGTIIAGEPESVRVTLLKKLPDLRKKHIMSNPDLPDDEIEQLYPIDEYPELYGTKIPIATKNPIIPDVKTPPTPLDQPDPNDWYGNRPMLGGYGKK